jgi:hypothetical protein
LAFNELNCLMISEEDLPRLVAVISSSAMSTVQTLFARLSCAVVCVGTGEKPDESSLVVALRQGHHPPATSKRN